MSNFQVVAISTDIADKARTNMKSPQYGHPAHVEPAKGYGPCRLCLRPFDRSVDERLLFTYNPFQPDEAPPAPGPIYIHAKGCPRYDGDGFPAAIRDLPLMFDGHDGAGLVSRRIHVSDESLETSIDQLLSDSSIRFINVRNAEAGCFIARIERA